MRGLRTSGGGGTDMLLNLVAVGFAFFAFLFMAIALSSGMSPNYMESVNIISFNTSTLGKGLIKAPDIEAAAKDGCDKAGNAVSGAGDKAGDLVGGVAGFFGGDDAKKKVNDAVDGAGDALGGKTGELCNEGAKVANDALKGLSEQVDKFLGSVAKALEIREYYSLHIGSLCEGNYKPLFSDAGARPDVQDCTAKFQVARTDLSKKLDEELQVGPFDVRLADLKLVDAIQKVLDLIPTALAAMAFLFLFATLGLVAGLLCAVAAAVLGRAEKLKIRKLALLAALACTGAGWLLSLVGVVGSTVVAEKVKDAVREHGKPFGMYASTSPAMYFLLWTSLVCSTAALALLAVMWWRLRTGRGLAPPPAAYAGKNHSADSHGYYKEEPVQGGGGYGPPPPPGDRYDNVPM